MQQEILKQLKEKNREVNIREIYLELRIKKSIQYCQVYKALTQLEKCGLVELVNKRPKIYKITIKDEKSKQNKKRNKRKTKEY